ncbi:MAG: hypothetical protein KDE58_15545 [Caldilineaceae bacterium]|nr:hypothetical protein [Caldilineaceae bacterium]
MELPRHRDSMGRFTAGNPGGPGRKKREAEEVYLATMEQVATLDAWRKICDRAVADAIAGDAKARSWLSGYLLGLPTQRFEQVEEVTGLQRILLDLGIEPDE